MDQKKDIVSPGELYVVGKILNADHIDYAYVATIMDIGESFEQFEKKMTDSLISKDLLEEDFSGSVSPKEETVNLFKPVFFGNTETTLDICSIEDPAKIDTYKFHFLDDRITKVTGVEGGMLQMESIGRDDLNALIDSFLLRDTSSEDVVAKFSKEAVTKYIVVKSNQVSESSYVSAFLGSDRQIYKEDESGNVICLKADEFKEELSRVLTGVV